MNKLSTTLVSALSCVLVSGLAAAPAMAGTATSKILDVQNPSTGVLSFRKDDMDIDNCASIYTGVIDPKTGEGIYGYLVRLDSYTTDTDVKDYVDYALSINKEVTINIDCDGPVYTGNSIQLGEIETVFTPGESWKSSTTIYEDSNIKVRLANKQLYIQDMQTSEVIWSQSSQLSNYTGKQQSKLVYTDSGDLELYARKVFFSNLKGNWQLMWSAGSANSNSVLAFDECGLVVKDVDSGTVAWDNGFNASYSQACQN